MKRNVLELSAKYFLEGCENCTLQVQRDILRNGVFIKRFEILQFFKT